MKNILFFVGFLCIISCNDITSQIIEDVQAPYFYKLIKEIDGVIIDVRTPSEFHSGHIKDATNINFYADDFVDKLKITRKDIPIYVYCRSGGRSSMAASKMAKLGFTKIYNLVGGIGAWNAANYITIKSEETNKILSPVFTVSQVDSILETNKTVLVAYSTQWCVPCKKMKPIIKQLELENADVKFLYIDADVNTELVKKYRVKGVPVFMIFKNSKKVFSHIGIIAKKDLLQKLN